MVGITSYGAYIPFYRLPRAVINKAWGAGGGQGEKAVANHDEDPITMSVAAGMDCLKQTDPKTVEGIFMATTSSPYIEGQNSTIIATALACHQEMRNSDFTNCLRAGTSALLSAFDAVKAGTMKRVLVTASDVRIGGPTGDNEQSFGDGSAALLVGDDKVAVEFEGSYSLSDNLMDNWRASDDVFVHSWEERFGLEEGYNKFPVEAVAGLMKKLKLTTKDFAKICLYGSNGKRQVALARKMGFQPEQIQDSLFNTVGNTGTALPLMILVAALEEAKPGDRILVVSYGNGSEAVSLKVTDEIKNIRDRRGIKGHLKVKKTLEDYGRYLRWRRIVPIEPAPRPERSRTSMSSAWRENTSALPLIGSKCKKCGTPQLFLDPVSTRARVCLNCHAKDEFEPYRFADKKAKIVSFSNDYLAASLDPPSTITVIDFEGGGRGGFLMTDRNPDECKVGLPMEMTFRKIFFEKSVHTYFWACKPARD